MARRLLLVWVPVRGFYGVCVVMDMSGKLAGWIYISQVAGFIASWEGPVDQTEAGATRTVQGSVLPGNMRTQRQRQRRAKYLELEERLQSREAGLTSSIQERARPPRGCLLCSLTTDLYYILYMNNTRRTDRYLTRSQEYKTAYRSLYLTISLSSPPSLSPPAYSSMAT